MKTQRMVSTAGILCLLGTGHDACAAGFALIEQSASGMGNAYAGAAAVAEDAGTIFFNPAGMAYLQGRQASAAIHAIRHSARFENTGSAAGLGRPLGNEGGDAGGLAFVPNLYYATEAGPDIRLGLGINAPFGLKTDYNDGWIGRFQADKSAVKTVNVNPAVSFKLNDSLALGFGVSAMRIEAELTRTINLVASESAETAKIKGRDWGYGYNLGAILQVTADTRVGVAWRSKVEQHLEGRASFPAPLTAQNGGVQADLTLPETLSVSAFSRLDDRWELLADATWTRWSRLRELRVLRDNGSTLTATPENWENTMRYSLGVNYRHSDALKLRAGLAYDEDAIKDAFRNARIPGNDRTWVALGASWRASPASKVDIGYAHLFIKDAPIDDNQATNGRLKGAYQSHVDILSVQYTYQF